MFPQTSVMSSKFMEDGLHSMGNSMPSAMQRSQRNLQIDSATETIENLAKKSDMNTVVTAILSRSIPTLQMYVMGQNEKPEDNVNGLALQAALLRMADTAVISSNLDINDNDATCLLETSEDQLNQKGSYQSKYILPYEVQAALNVVIDKIISKHKAQGGSGKMFDIISELKASQPGNYFDFPVAKTSLQDATDTGGVTYFNDHPNIDNYEVIKGDEPIPIEPPIIDTNKSGGILDFIDKAIQTVVDTAGDIKTVADKTADAIENVKDKLSDAGGEIVGDSLSKGIVRNIPLIAGIVIGLAIIIILIVYGAKYKGN